MKRNLIKLFLLVASFLLVVSLPVVQEFCLKKIVNFKSSYSLQNLQGLHLNFFPLTIQIDSAQISQKKSLDNVIANKIEIVYKSDKWLLAADYISYNAANTTGLLDIKSFTPEVLANILQRSFKSLKNIASIKIHKFCMDGEEVNIAISQKSDQIIGKITHASGAIDLLCDASQIIASGIWQGYPISFSCKIAKNVINFEGKTLNYKGIPQFLRDSLGEQLFIKGILVHNQEWNLDNFELASSNHHKITGNCTQKREQLNGLFTWNIPKSDQKTATVCKIIINGFAQQPHIELQFSEGIQPLKKLLGTLDIIDSKHLKLTASAFYNDNNQAACDFNINLDPFTIDGKVDANVQELEKLLHNFFPNVKGKLKIKGNFFNCQSFTKGEIDLSTQANVHIDGVHLPLQINCKINDGKGQGDLKITKGSYDNMPLDLVLHFVGDGNVVNVNSCNLSLADLRLNLIKPFAYDFTKGAENIKCQFLGGSITANNLLFSNPIKNSLFSLTFENIQLKYLSRFLDNSALSGMLNAEFMQLADQNFKGSVSLSKVNWQKNQNKQLYKVIENLNCNLKASGNDQKLEWNFNVQDSDKLNLQSSGSADLIDNKIDGSIKGSAKLKLLNDMLATGDRIYGDISLNIHFKGDTLSPNFEGFVNADNGLYEHNEVGTYYQNITIRTYANGKRFIVKQFTAQDIRSSKDPNFAQLNGEGWVDFSNPFQPEFNVPMHMKHLRIAQHDGFISDATGTLTITGKGAEVGCKGEATLENATYFLDQGSEGKVLTIENRKHKKSKANKSKEYATAFPLDILIHCPENTFKVVGMGANTIWKGNFYVKKSIANPFLVGVVTLQDGTIDVLGRVLKLTKGNITFVEDDRNNPRLDIVASQSMGDGLTVSMEIKGTGENTVIDFTSTPNLQKEEILSLLIFGKRLGEVSVLQSMQLASLVKADSKQGDSFFAKLRSGFGFDEFEFKTVTTGGASANDADATPQERAAAKTSQAVRIGKDFGKVRVAVEQGTGTANSKVVVSTPLGKNLALQGDVGSAQNSGVGISWVKRY
jgi:autotransporter translocation and assembly factor TamB